MRFTSLVLLCFNLSPAAFAQVTGASGRVEFNRDIRPIFNEKCIGCHGGVKKAGGLSLQFEADIRVAGKSSSIPVVPGDVTQSELIRRLTCTDLDERMPKEKPALNAQQIELITRWVKEGAKWADHWAYEKPVAVTAPATKRTDWNRSLVDPFVLARLEQKGLSPAAPADKAILLRRLSLDLTGLPATTAELDAFVTDRSLGALAKQVDRLMASRQFGERWAALWMDLARYNDSQGYEKDNNRPMWPYRDWVIQAFNQDLPYDQFITKQLAGDLLPHATEDDLVATAFHRLTRTNTEGGTDNEEFRSYAVMDRVTTTATAFLGTTMGCVQCHGHPYDPFRQTDYYGLFAYFNTSEDADRDDDAPNLSFLTATQKARQAELKKQIAELGANPASAPDVKSKAAKAAAIATKNDIPPEDPKVVALRAELGGLKAVRLPIMKEQADKDRRASHVLIRGAWSVKGAPITPFTPPAMGNQLKGGTRLDLAKWIAAPQNPLTARVLVNNIWKELWGQGLVGSPDDFGTIGEAPSHQALLDTLAVKFSTEWKWSVKRLLRELVLSATYQQASNTTAALRGQDPYNRLLARGPRTRLSAEMIRDQALAVSGLLVEKRGGASIMPEQPDGIWKAPYSEQRWEPTKGPEKYGRTLYIFWKRSSPFPASMVFDSAERDVCVAKRLNTNTPLHALVTMNEPAFVDAAKALGKRLAELPGDEPSKINAGLRAVLAATARPEELAAYRDCLVRNRQIYAAKPKLAQDAGLTAEQAAWWQVVTVMLNSDRALNKE